LGCAIFEKPLTRCIIPVPERTRRLSAVARFPPGGA